MTLTLDQLTAQATEAMNALTPDKGGRREASASTTTDKGAVIVCSMSQGRYRARWGGLEIKTKVQYKMDSKVTSKASLLDILGGKAKQEINEALRSAFEAQAPQLAAEYVEWITRAYTYQLEQFDGKLPAYPGREVDKFVRQAILQTIAPHCDTVRVEGDHSGRKSTLVLNESKLAEIAKRYADEAAVQWFYKTNAKLGALENPELIHDKSGSVVVTGMRGGKAISLEQQRILKSSPLGNLFHQFPARIHVDGKFTPERAYHKLFD